VGGVGKVWKMGCVWLRGGGMLGGFRVARFAKSQV